MKLSISEHFHNKENRAPNKPDKHGELSNRWAMGAFTTVDRTPEQIVAHMKAGKAICVAALEKNWRGIQNFISSEIMGIDFDESPGIAKLLEDDFIRDYAFYVYATPSHTDTAPRSRVLFALDAPITDGVVYKTLITRLLAKMGQYNADRQCKDPVRLFYGSDLKVRPGVNTSKRLPLSVLEALPETDEERRAKEFRERPTTVFQPADSYQETMAQKYAAKARQNILDRALEGNVEGFRHHAFISAVWQLVAMQKGGWIGFDAAADARYLGSVLDREPEEIDAALRGAERKVDADWFDFKPRPREQKSAQPDTPLASTYTSESEKPAPALTWRTSDEAMESFRDRLITAPTDYVPMLFPFTALHQYGGFAYVLDAGILVGVVGTSGGMKTSFLETITDTVRRRHGADIIWWGTEWNYESMADRAIQRYGGASMIDVKLHRIALWEKQQTPPPKVRRGKELPYAMIEASQKISGQIQNVWQGKAHYIEQPVSDTTALLTATGVRVDSLRESGRDVRIAVFDYLQLLDLYSARTESERITTILGKLKLFCIEKKLIGIVASQVTKSAGHDAKNGDGLLQAESGQFLRSDKFNLVLTLNPVYANGMLTDKGVINVVKNSLGKTGAQEVPINPSRFLWRDVDDERQPVQAEPRKDTHG